MRILCFNRNADSVCDRVEKALADHIHPKMALLNKKKDLCDYEILLVTVDELVPEKLSCNWYDPQKIIALHTAFRSFLNSVKSLQPNPEAQAIIDSIGMPISPSTFGDHALFVRRFLDEPTGKRFFYLIFGLEKDSIFVSYVYFLCNLWAIENGFAPIHSAGVIHNENLYLFSGTSGAGKTTIARMSKEIGDAVLDEELVLIPSLPAKNYIARGWGYGLNTSNAPLRAVFNIVQDDKDYLLPLSQTQTARFLVERSIEELGNYVHNETMSVLFNRVATIARSVPGYELHFRKSLYFWKLIDEQIPT